MTKKMKAATLFLGAALGVTLTLATAAACAPDDTTPPAAEPVVTYGEWVTGNFGCGDTTVQITRTGTSTLDGHTETFYQTETVALTAEQLATLDCDTEPTKPATPATPAKPAKPATPAVPGCRP